MPCRRASGAAARWAGAWWTRGYRTLEAYSHDSLLRIGVAVRGFSDADRLRAAKALGRHVVRNLGGS